MKVQLFAGQETSIARRGWFFRILSATTDLDVRISRSNDGKQFYKGVLSSGIGIDFLSNAAAFNFKPFDTVYVKAAEDQLIDVWIEEVKADDDRLSGNFDINAALSVAATLPKYSRYEQITVAAGVATLFPVNVNRRGMTVLPSAEIVLDTGYTVSDGFEWNSQQGLTVTGTNGTTIDIFEDFD
tara:strand:+ start:577 stop:1128 length:552 start_codon:yes stop_codon:yes gene_type:complete